MQDVSTTYLEIVSELNHHFETKVVINGLYTFDMGEIFSLITDRKIFADEDPSVGCCVAGEIDISLLDPSITLPSMAKIEPYIRAVGSNQTSEWIPKGKFWIDTRESSNDGGIRRLNIHGYDAMLKTEADFPIGSVSEWPSTDIEVVEAIADQIGVDVDDRVYDIIVNGYAVQLPSGYTSREVLGFIGAMYAGCWIINDPGKLQLIVLNGLPAETNYLTDESGNMIMFGGTRILV